MCTAVTLKTEDFYFGRTLDLDHSYAEEVTFTPRCFPLNFREEGTIRQHYAILGMAYVPKGEPLYYDAVNEKGLVMAGLNFVGNACYHSPMEGKHNIAHFELIPWILARCASVSEAKALLEGLNVTDQPYSNDLPVSELHWLLADKQEAVTVEAVSEGLRIYPNPVGVLTNNPTFDDQLFQLNNYMHLSTEQPNNRFSDLLDLKPYSRGMGALGLPGDLSSQSRFVRAAFTKLNSVSRSTEGESVSQFFHIMETVSQTRGCCKVGEEQYEITVYTSCCNVDRGIYYYTTYENRQINGVEMRLENMDGSKLVRYPLVRREQIHTQNKKSGKN